MFAQIQKINMGGHVWLGDRVIHQQTVPARSVDIVMVGTSLSSFMVSGLWSAHEFGDRGGADSMTKFHED